MQKSHILYSGQGKALALEIYELLDPHLRGDDGVTQLIHPAITCFSQGEYLCKLNGPLNGNAIIVGSIKNNDDLMEILSIIDAAKRAGAVHITLIAPYIAYSRQNLMQQPFSSVGIEIIAKMIKASGVDKLVTVDIHSLDSLKFFGMEVVHITIQDILAHYKNQLPQNCVLVAPDKGCAERAVISIYLSKKRMDGLVSMELHGDVRGKDCLVIDDIFDSGGTIVKAFEILKQNGAGDVYGYATHFLGEKILLPIYTTNSLPLIPSVKDFSAIFSLADMIARHL